MHKQHSSLQNLHSSKAKAPNVSIFQTSGSTLSPTNPTPGFSQAIAFNNKDSSKNKDF